MARPAWISFYLSYFLRCSNSATCYLFISISWFLRRARVSSRRRRSEMPPPRGWRAVRRNLIASDGAVAPWPRLRDLVPRHVALALDRLAEKVGDFEVLLGALLLEKSKFSQPCRPDPSSRVIPVTPAIMLLVLVRMFHQRHDFLAWRKGTRKESRAVIFFAMLHARRLAHFTSLLCRQAFL